jgi:hypothetical protein
MLATTAHNNTTALRNYAIIAASIILMSSGLTNVFFNPARTGQQDRIDTYSSVISAGLVAQAQNLGR